MFTLPTLAERRADHRIMVAGTGHLFRDLERVGTYLLHDLSHGGCLLSGGPMCQVGASYRLVLQTPDGARVREEVMVARQLMSQAHGLCLGIAFVASSPKDEPLCSVLDAHGLCRQSARSGRVLIAHRSRGARQAIAAVLARLGYDVAQAASVAEAVWELENGPMDFHTALISRSLRGSHGEEVLRFLASMYPHVRRVLIAQVPFSSDESYAPHAQMVLPEVLDEQLVARVLPDAGVEARTGVPALQHFGIALANASSALHP